MEIKEIHVECKLSRNYNTHTVSFTGTLDKDDIPELKVKELQARARKLVMEQINLK